LLKIFSLEAPFISAGNVRGIKASKKMSFSMPKLLEAPVVGLTKNCNFFEKFFSKDDLGHKK
jgi:hypothetical protein